MQYALAFEVEVEMTGGLMSVTGYGGHGFWIHPIRISVSPSREKTVTGQISHILGWCRPDDQIYFTTVFDGNTKQLNVPRSTFKINRGGYSRLVTPVVTVVGIVVGAFNPIAGGIVVTAGTRAPELTKPIEDLFAGSWESVLNMLLAEIACQTVPALRFHWSIDGNWNNKPNGYIELCINEPSDPAPWADNWLLIENDCQCDWRWSFNGRPNGYECISINEPSDPNTWVDNYLCYRGDCPYEIKFTCAGPDQSFSFIPIVEPADPHTWSDNFLNWRLKNVR